MFSPPPPNIIDDSMFSPTPPPTASDDSEIQPISQSDGITDSDIADLCRFLFRSTNDTGGLPLEYPRRNLDVEQTSRLTHAPLHGVTGFNRSRLVLDALVAICVCTSSHCLALSASFGPKRVLITVAENDTTPSPMIRTHLTSIWGQLGALATLQKRLRRDFDFLDAAVDEHGTSPRAVESYLPLAHDGMAGLTELKGALQRDIHKHCYLKTKQRLKKYLLSYDLFYKFYRRNRKALDPTDVITDVAFNLEVVHRIVMEYKGPMLPTGVPAQLNWDELARFSSVLLRIYTDDQSNVQKKIGDVIEAWLRTKIVQDNRKLRSLDLARGLEKMVSLPRHIQELVNFAYSPRLRSILEKPVEIALLSPTRVQLREPSAPDVSRTVSRAFYSTTFARSHRSEDQEVLDETLADQLDLIPGTLTAPVSSHTVHAEYALLLHHHAELYNSANPPPFQYIAVNKLACFCCWAAYEAYRHATGRIFSLRGSHSKLYFPWAPATTLFPPVVGDRVRAYLYTQIVQLYSTHLVQLEDAKNRLSDSSVASQGAGVGVLVHLDDVQESRRLRMDEDAREEAEMKDAGEEVW